VVAPAQDGTGHCASVAGCAAASTGLTATAIAAEIGICIQTASKWWRRHAASGPEGLLDEARPGQPRKLRDADVTAFGGWV
jgi:transposase